MTPVERVAKAAHEAKIRLCWGPQFVGKREPWPDFDDPAVKRAYPHSPIAYVDISLEQARAAIAALHEPSEAMMRAALVEYVGHNEDYESRDSILIRVYHAMNAAALAEK